MEFNFMEASLAQYDNDQILQAIVGMLHDSMFHAGVHHLRLFFIDSP
ncbi:hypothetical protein Plim_1855 [Planctopirus limnophila DSM 3776]|uniref:Uncharacterized protein n=1 Tax=Planctopirus limnophila (strain ATCC 43296 / DSM 3776 / IFAM 1008 / Mu 290) TaxID=521674 RepID=D5SYF7_PLAL2|nr:hypothetical protein Plim_1855 [Planctopirus limnophila DSM 3776]